MNPEIEKRIVGIPWLMVLGVALVVPWFVLTIIAFPLASTHFSIAIGAWLELHPWGFWAEGIALGLGALLVNLGADQP